MNLNDLKKDFKNRKYGVYRDIRNKGGFNVLVEQYPRFSRTILSELEVRRAYHILKTLEFFPPHLEKVLDKFIRYNSVGVLNKLRVNVEWERNLILKTLPQLAGFDKLCFLLKLAIYLPEWKQRFFQYAREGYFYPTFYFGKIFNQSGSVSKPILKELVEKNITIINQNLSINIDWTQPWTHSTLKYITSCHDVNMTGMIEKFTRSGFKITPGFKILLDIPEIWTRVFSGHTISHYLYQWVYRVQFNITTAMFHLLFPHWARFNARFKELLKFLHNRCGDDINAPSLP